MKNLIKKAFSIENRYAMKKGCALLAGVFTVAATVLGMTGVNKYEALEGYKEAIKELNEPEKDC